MTLKQFQNNKLTLAIISKNLITSSKLEKLYSNSLIIRNNTIINGEKITIPKNCIGIISIAKLTF